MKTIEALTEELEKLTALAGTCLDDIHPSVRGAWSTVVAESSVKLKDVQAEYKSVLLSNSLALFTEGDPARIQDFVRLAHEENEALVVDAEAMYRRLATDVEATVAGHRQWGVAQTNRLNLALRELMTELHIAEIPMPSRDDMPYLATSADTLEFVKKSVRSGCGDLLNRIFIQNAVAVDALSIRYIGMMAPVIVLNATKDETYDLARAFGKGSTTVEVMAEDVVDKEFLAKTFKEVSKRIRGAKKSINKEETKKLTE